MGFKDAGKPQYLGHRERLRTRFREAGADAVPDYELLEIVLFRAMPRRDTKPIAKAILARFGTFAKAVNAPEDLLLEIPGLGDAAITEIMLVRTAALRLMRGEVLERPLLGSWKQVLDYCRAAMGFEAKEQFRILFLDKRNKMIADEVQQGGTVDHTPVYVLGSRCRSVHMFAAGGRNDSTSHQAFSAGGIGELLGDDGNSGRPRRHPRLQHQNSRISSDARHCRHENRHAEIL